MEVNHIQFIELFQVLTLDPIKELGQSGQLGRLRWFGHMEHKSVDD